MGLWLLIPEHLRMGTWDLLRGWAVPDGGRVEGRLALQLVHEAALCATGVRRQRALSQRGFELANGLPFVASDTAIHHLLDDHTVAEAQRLQIALGRIRRASGHFQSELLAIDPHRIQSFSKRQMRRFRSDESSKPKKVVQTFFALDPDTHQPVCFTIASSSCTATQAGIQLLDMAAEILQPKPQQILVLADAEHFSADLIGHIVEKTPFDALVPMIPQPAMRKRWRAIPENQFIRRWAGYATCKRPYKLTRSKVGPLYEFVQRTQEKPEKYGFHAYLSTTDRDEVETLTDDFPKRWHVEEFFNAHQALGWNRAGTMNLNVRYGQMTMALLAQTAISQLRERIGEPIKTWDSAHLAKSFFSGIEGDIRVVGETIVVTYYNAPNVEQLRRHYEGLPEKLANENIDPRIPWLYDFKLDFRFK